MLLRWIVAGMFAMVAYGQPAAKFDVASVREITDGVRVMNNFESSGNRAQFHGFSVQMLVMEAWNVRGDQVVFAPGVSAPMKMDSGKSSGIFEIQAAAPEGTTPTRDEFRRMLQALLAERFRLKTHRETRELPVYVLTAEKPQLKPSPGEGTCKRDFSRTPEGQRIVAQHCRMDVILGTLFVDRPIYDETGLTGTYDFTITAAIPRQNTDPLAITPFSAVKELGLKLEPKTRTVEVIVIDAVQGPGEN